ncbi:MAG: CusA/CzcA family heavy metal efflux RND transporter [Bacteriovoracaceae bacterium]|nr:CusA/CzcA family heavy metal efflux RND transporter [Bacteriovoracaceae bacterium]
MKTSVLDRSIDWSLQNKFWVISLSFIFLCATIYKVNDLSVDAVPDITNVQVVINTKTLGLDPEKVELTVTQPIEFEMMGVPKLKDMRSISKFGLSQVILVFSDDTDIYWARQQVAEKMQMAIGQLPAGIQPELAPISTGLGEVYMYSLSLKEDSPLKSATEQDQLLYLREIQDYQVRPTLRRIKDVADVDSNGGYKKQLHLNIRPELLTRYGLTMEKVEKKLVGLGESFGGGSVEIAKEALLIKASTSLPDIKTFEDISIGQKYNGDRIYLKDVATISIDAAPRLGGATLNGKETVLGTVLMTSGGNGRVVSQDVETALDHLELPKDVLLTKLYSRGFLVNTTLKTVIKNLAEGAALVILILLLVLGHFRAALIVSIVIPLSMLGTTLGMQYFHISGNLMSLGAIDFGLVVDGAVVLVETLVGSFYLLTAEEKKNLNKDQIVSSKAKQVMRPVVFGLLMIMLVYVPILLLEGVEGKMFRPMAYTVLMTLGWSLLMTIFLIPVLVSLFVKIPEATHHEEHETAFFKTLKKVYQPVLMKLIDKPKQLIAGGLVLAALSILCFLKLGADFIPQLDEGDLVVNITRDAKISLTEALNEQEKADQVISKIPEVEKVFSRLGTPESATDPMGVHLSDTFIILKKDRSLWISKTKEEVFEKIKKSVEDLGFKQDISSTQPIEMRFNEMLEGSRADVSLRIVGQDLDYMVEVIDGFAEKVSGVEGLEGAEMDPLTALRKSRVIDIKPNFAELARLGISLDEFSKTVVGYMQGSPIGQWIRGIRKFPIVMHLTEEKRNNIEEIKNLPVSLPDGGTIPLERVASIQLVDQVTTIARTWGQRYAALSLNMANRDTMSFVGDIEKIVEKNPVKSDHKLHLGGQFNNLIRAKKRLLIIIPLTLLLILFILWREFSSALDAMIIFLCVPFAAFGGVFALYFRDIHLSLSAAVGFIALIGIALLNGIVLLTVFNQLKESTGNKSLKDIVIEGTLSRLRPVVMTALVASIGFIPMAINTGLGSEVQRPLATVVIGGILFSTLLTLILFPTVYLYFYEKKKVS